MAICKAESKEDLALLMSRMLREYVIPTILNQSWSKRLEVERSRKKNFTNVWRGLSEENKIRVIYLGK